MILKLLSTYKYLILIALMVVAGWIYIGVLNTKLNNTTAALNIATNNEKAYQMGLQKWEDRYGQEHAKTIMFNENLTSFKTSQDSITQKLVTIIGDQAVDIKKLRQASLIQTKVTTTLTREVQTKLPDTVVDLSNKNVKNIITLTPYRISSDIEFYNDQTILARDSVYKTYIPRRYDFFLRRWFQHKEKNTAVLMEVINSNPLMKTEQQKFIHFIKDK